MKNPNSLAGALAVILFGSTGIGSLSAQLPSLDKQPWLGYFAIAETRRSQFKIASQGKITLSPLDEKGKAASGQNEIRVSYGIQEMLPDGKTRQKTVEVASLESAESATDRLEKTVIRGKVTGDAAFEMTVEQDRGVISIGGRITDPGKLTTNPLRFFVSATIPNVYSRDKRVEKKDIKAFEKKIKDDGIAIEWIDGKRTKKSFEEPVDASSKEITGPGIAEAEVEIAGYKDRELVFAATEKSAITLSNSPPAPLYEGFTLTWTPDATKDQEGKARFTMEVK
jgi:hypothetical protein